MSARKSLTLREKLKTTIFNWVYAERNGMETVDRILRLFREEQRKKCHKCEYRQKIEDGYVHYIERGNQ